MGSVAPWLYPQGGVLVRLLQLPMVSATRQVLQETYSSTKQTHPLICTVCGVYERGARKAGSLAVWTIQPAIHRLETHISAVDVLACKGLDRLEERIPALQYPPDKVGGALICTPTHFIVSVFFSLPL
uniref:Uncharacterized protein n=1 Tax=Paramormyrops kingsleyae TaxID=1676925 RepID=A0A3B3QAD4_9TELE